MMVVAMTASKENWMEDELYISSQKLLFKLLYHVCVGPYNTHSPIYKCSLTCRIKTKCRKKRSGT